MKNLLNINYVLFCLSFHFSFITQARSPDSIYFSNIRSVKLYKSGDLYSYPVITLNGNDKLELHFDDMDGDVKFYYYSFQLCDADWRPANVQAFDYIRGFLSNRITTYRMSSLISTRYTHYMAVIPERNSVPSRGGNYLLKVYLNDDTTKIAFTRRFLVVNSKVQVSGFITQPYNARWFRTHQRIQAQVIPMQGKIQIISPQDLKMVIVPNYIWKQSQYFDRPTFFRGNFFEYSDEEAGTFPAGKEWRWVDLRSLRIRSERMLKIIDSDTSKRIDVYVNPDSERSHQLYVYFRDYNGLFSIENRDQPNAFWQSEYAWVHFTYVPKGNRAYPGKNVYIFGELTQYECNENSRMTFNEEKGVYEKALYLKQGFYNYNYVTVPDNQTGNISYEFTEGNFWGTENAYMLLVYFRPPGARADELVGYALLNSFFQQ
ncbi:MAG: DUF5103 domain-containing protein [Chitinophagaceae bacterium]|nr:DUF5103 domain-containing protein [Chitinophagaceae bacterium]